MKNTDTVRVSDALLSFFGTADTACVPHGNGHINHTFLVTKGGERYILQRMNTHVFPRPAEVMENIIGVTEHIRKKTAEAGGDTRRATLEIIRASDGGVIYTDTYGECWRAFRYTERTVSLDRANGTEQLYKCAEAFGRFCTALSDYPASTLHETIKDFHNTPVRYKALMSAVRADRYGRAAECEAEIAFAARREFFCGVLEDAHARGELPLRVTHNDTKLNNILFDKDSGEPVCVIDLDTVMAGYSVNDFGDAIRYAASTAAEDETELSAVSLDLELFEAYAKGFLRGCEGGLTDKEIELLPIGAIMMTLECGMRFLTDYLEGDVYFRIHRPRHNLDRARNQFALAADMEKKLPLMQAVIQRLKK